MSCAVGDLQRIINRVNWVVGIGESTAEIAATRTVYLHGCFASNTITGALFGNEGKQEGFLVKFGKSRIDER